jgi:limonene-1,2-epoxide hydrolase
MRSIARDRPPRPCENSAAVETDTPVTEVPMNAEEVVRAEMQAWSSLDVDQIMAHFTADASWLPGFGFPTWSGYDEIRRAVEGFVNDMTWAEIEILNLAVAGNVVLTERVDRFIYKGNRIDAPGMGTFEIVGDKITAWRDYFYTGDHE